MTISEVDESTAENLVLEMNEKHRFFPLGKIVHIINFNMEDNEGGIVKLECKDNEGGLVNSEVTIDNNLASRRLVYFLHLAQFQSIKSACDHLVISDVSDFWHIVKSGFEERLPFKRDCLNNKTPNLVYVETGDRFPQEQSLFWFREPYATVVLVTCEMFKTILKPRLKLIVQNDEREYFIVFVSKAQPSNDQATKQKISLSKFVLLFYEDEIRKLSEQRFMSVWNFCNFFIFKLESLAFMFEMTHLHEDSLRDYDELELCYWETAALVKPDYKALPQIVQDVSFREFEFRQYLFSCQSKLLLKLDRPVEVASRGYSFIISFSKALAFHENSLPFCIQEVWSCNPAGPHLVWGLPPTLSSLFLHPMLKWG
ncbi:hypothetical protein AQUCO_01300153v1 [Aquilegia coerulea]|uniref:TRAPPC10/Trs130 N-terminal domain-containing protein n=1 Tax=Aquilegia coerulea TaxID=218851 RepID=A0A2G5DZZ9_AQUCA|nr:hypothetical protein AQUCO_01300153v1 [Aquilegia coerulea]